MVWGLAAGHPRWSSGGPRRTVRGSREEWEVDERSTLGTALAAVTAVLRARRGVHRGSWSGAGDDGVPATIQDAGDPTWSNSGRGSASSPAATASRRRQRFSFWVRPADPAKVVLFLDGGGACWDAAMQAFSARTRRRTTGTCPTTTTRRWSAASSTRPTPATRSPTTRSSTSRTAPVTCTSVTPHVTLRARCQRSPQGLRQRLDGAGVPRRALRGRRAGRRRRRERRVGGRPGVRRPGGRRPARGARHGVRRQLRHVPRAPLAAPTSSRNRLVPDDARLGRERRADARGLGSDELLDPGRPTRPRPGDGSLRLRVRRDPGDVHGPGRPRPIEPGGIDRRQRSGDRGRGCRPAQLHRARRGPWRRGRRAVLLDGGRRRHAVGLGPPRCLPATRWTTSTATTAGASTDAGDTDGATAATPAPPRA